MFNMFHIVLIATIGIACAALNERFGSRPNSSRGFFFVYAYLFGFIIYIIATALHFTFGGELKIHDAEFWENTDVGAVAKLIEVMDEMISIILLSAVLIYAWLFVSSRDLLSKLLIKFKIISEIPSRGSLFLKIMDRGGYAFEYIRISDYKKKIIFEGFVATYSENSDSKHILLKDPVFHDLSGRFLYSRSYFDVHLKGPVAIEFPRGHKKTENGKRKSDFWKKSNKGHIREYESLERPPPPEPISVKPEKIT